MTGDQEEPRIEWIRCNTCAQETKHEVIAERRQDGSEPYDEDISIWWSTTYTMLECRGCESVSMRRRFTFSEWDPGDAQVEFFPPPVSRNKPRWAERLPEDEQSLLAEIYAALAADSRRLALMGERTLMDMFILRKIGDEGTFVEKLNKLQSEGLISPTNREVIEVALEAGHAAVHRGYVPESEQLSSVMDIVESVLHSDLLTVEANELRKAIPKRKRQSRSEDP
jgi:hypothetical protein